ncbi:MAG: WecB/TagA/CpsF family glycosyltransferase [Butyrivibrio sp.]|nr:WecB/TagA/CpsF family glycosyltransferase [Butyrivibrio sp.]
MDSAGYTVRPGIVIDVAGYATVPAYVRDDKFDIFGIHYSIARVEEAVLHVINHLSELRGKYICFSNVHTTVMAKNSKEYADILNGAAFLFPDGSPIANREKNDGYIGAERVAGPDFMKNMFRDTQDGKLSHYFYGSTEETLSKLRSNLESEYPGLNIKGMYSPPFRALSPEEDEADIKRINDSGADIVWIGLGAPKQEKWMKAHEGKINAVMMGVGAGFDFHAGTAKRAPLWVQRIGLEWLFRLFTDPKRLFKRYFATNIEFIWSSFWDKLKIRNK